MTRGDRPPLRAATMTPRPTGEGETAREELRAQLRARRELVAQAIAEGKSDIVFDEPVTEAERNAMGLDRGFFDDEDEAAQAVADRQGEAAGRA